MKFSTVLLATCLIAFTAAQWPCHDYGWNGAISNCASCTIGGNTGGNAWTNNNGWFSVCTNCTAGFYLNQSACIPCTNNCTACYSNGACVSTGCAFGYAFNPTNNTCMACPSSLNCARCAWTGSNVNSYGVLANGPFVCTSCVSTAFYISSSGACTACPTGCASVALSHSSFTSQCPGGTCTSCATTAGYINTGTGTVTCSACGSNCNACSAVGTCTTCASNAFYLSGGVCTACTLANCISCTGTNAATCDAGGCASGYYLSGGVCTACPTGCTTCSSATACTACATGYYIGSAAPAVCTAVPTASLGNCSTWQQYTAGPPIVTGGWCTACVSGSNTTLSTVGTCVPCPSNCTSCVLASSSATTAICLRCQLGYGLNDTTGNCVQCPPNCDYCDGSGVCTQCRAGSWSNSAASPVVAGLSWTTTVAGVSTTSTLPISQGFYLPPNQCQQCPYNCSSCANSTFCFNNCTKNYVFNATTNQCLPNGASRIVLAGFAFLGALFYFI